MRIGTARVITDFPTERKSSIYQHRGLLGMLIRGEWCPLVFNQVDGVECGKIKYHKIALSIKPGLNWTFPVGTCHYVKNNYLLTHKDKLELNPLPEFFGDGLYEDRVREQVFTNVGKEAVGIRQEKTLRVGKDYVTAKRTLKGVTYE